MHVLTAYIHSNFVFQYEIGKQQYDSICRQKEYAADNAGSYMVINIVVV